MNGLSRRLRSGSSRSYIFTYLAMVRQAGTFSSFGFANLSSTIVPSILLEDSPCLRRFQISSLRASEIGGLDKVISIMHIK